MMILKERMKSGGKNAGKRNLSAVGSVLAGKGARIGIVFFFCLFHALFSLSVNAASARRVTPVARAEPVRVMAHDSGAFTQGLFLDGDILYESEGLYGWSRIVRRSFPQGTFLGSMSLSREYFGEGCAMVGDDVFVLTWKEETAFVLDRELSLKRKMSYTGEGWGLTTDGKFLWRSNGGAVLTRHDPKDFSVVGRLVVRDNGSPVPLLNELEWADGWIYANVWKSDRIAVIDPENGNVALWIDCSGLVPLMYAGEEGRRRARETGACLNGIAWRKETDTLLITGKFWPMLYEIRRPRMSRP